MLFEWKDQYNLNVKEIDSQHRRLVGIINDLHAAMQNGATKDRWQEILNQLKDYSQYHFFTEENFMLKYDFTGYGDHRQEHELFKARIAAIEKSFVAGDLEASDELMYFLVLWLKNHILDVDKKCGVYLNEKGVV